MSERLYYCEPTNELVIAEYDPSMGWFILHWEDESQCVEPMELRKLHLVGEL